MAGPPVRERYNSKARGSVAGGGSHKKRKRLSGPKTGGSDDEAPPNPPAQAPFGQGMGTKKRKRMESYIAKKLKSESRAETIKLLASLAPAQSTSSGLLSSSSLGQNPLNPTSAQERKEQREDRLVRRGIDVLRNRHGSAEDSSGDDGEEEMDGRTARRRAKGKEREIVEGPSGMEGMTAGGSAPESQRSHPQKIGGGKKKAKKSKASSWNPNLLRTQPQSDSDFDSSDSDGDVSGSSSAGPSSPKGDRQPPSTVIHRTGAKLADVKPEDAIIRTPVPPSSTGSALKRPAVVGGALKKSADGVAVAPRIAAKRAEAVESEDDDGKEEEERDTDDADGSDGDEDSDEDDEGVDSENEEEESDEDDEDDEDEDEDDHLPRAPNKERSLGFKSWALKQMGQAEPPSAPDLLDEAPPTSTAASTQKVKSRPKVPPGNTMGPLGETFNIPASSLLDHTQADTMTTTPHAGTSSLSRVRPAINRRPSVAEARLDLPILAEEQNIVEAIRMNSVVVICGETGSGKTTQVPQMLYEAGFGCPGSDNPGMIAVTQPRRVAAVSLAARVKSELNIASSSGIVAHQIRYSSTTAPETAIKFMTDGVLLRELSADFLLSRYSVVVVDEAHERGVNTDVLIGVLSRVAKLREKKWREAKSAMTASDSSAASTSKSMLQPLRIIIMSATLRLSDFTSNRTLFPTPPPTIHIPARQHPVTIHFSRKTAADYVTEAYKKVCKIHARLPVGGVLVFMTGQAEIMGLCRKLEKRYGKGNTPGSGRQGAAGMPEGKKQRQRGEAGTSGSGPSNAELPPEDREAEDIEFGQDNDLAADVDDGDVDAVSDPEALDTDDEDEGDFEMEELSDAPLHILPLYSLLSNEQQLRVFQPPPAGHRLVIIATNVAETSLTIPGIRYVVDAGRAKERTFDTASGVQSFQVQWISKASANQRAGRAGRTGPGHCYRLYSSALFEDHFASYGMPEILRMPIEGVVLQMKSMGIDQVVNFPFPTPPDRSTLRKAEVLLQTLGALSSPTSTSLISGTRIDGATGGQITALGRQMSEYPVSPRFAKMLAIGNQHGALPYVVAVVAGMSVGDPFVHESAIEVEDEDADGAEYAILTGEEARRKEERKEARKRYFRAQSAFLSLGNAASDVFKLLAAIGGYEFEPTATFCQKNFLRVKAMQEIAQLRSQISGIAGVKKGSADRLKPPTDTQLKVIRQIITSAFIDQVAVRLDVAEKKPSSFLSCRNVPYRLSSLSTDIAYIHPASALFHRPPPEYVVYTELHRTGKDWMKGVTRINSGWIWNLGKGLCSLTKSTELDGAGGGERVQAGTGGMERTVGVVPHLRGLGVDLPAVKIKQRREGSRWVYVE